MDGGEGVSAELLYPFDAGGVEARLLQATRRQDKAACQRHRIFSAVVEKDVGLLLIKPLSKQGKFNWLVIDTPGESQFAAVISKRQNVCRDPWLDKRPAEEPIPTRTYSKLEEQ